MPIRVFGAPPNRTHRVLWMLEEAGLEYELVRLHSEEEIAASEELSRYNPNRKVPTLVDGDVVVWDSLAINLYLADRYAVLRPGAPAGLALATQWSIWAQTDLDPNLLGLAKASVLPEDERDPAVLEAARTALDRAFGTLEATLADREHLLGGEFSVADLNVAAVLVVAKPIGIDLVPYARLDAWLRSCLRRPAAREVFGRVRDER